MEVFTDQNYLVARLKAGDEEACSFLYDNYGGALYGLIIKMVQNQMDADDLLQDIFHNIFLKIHSFDESKGFSLYTWMIRIARNKCIDHLRSKGRTIKIQNQEENVSVENDSKLSTHMNIDSIGLREIVDQMSPDLKKMIDLFYFGGYTHAEITELTNIPLGTVKTKIRNAMIELRKVFHIS